MNFKSSFVMNLINRLTPFVKNGGKSAECSKKIHFKPSDCPVLEEIPQVQDMTVSKDATVVPFADRILQPDLFGLTPVVNNTKKLIQTTEHLIEKCEDEGIKTNFSKLYSNILDNMKNLPKETHRMTSLMKSVEMVDNPKIKAQILDKVGFLNGCNPKKFKEFYPSLMSFMENYADAANTISGKYMCIDNDTQKFYKWMDKKNIWFLDIIDGTKKSEDTYRKGLISSDKRNKKYQEYLKNYDEYTEKGLKETFQNNLKQDAMKKFFEKYIDTRKEAIDTLYHEEYLKTLPPEIAKECGEVQKEYNTHVITSNHDTTLEDIKYLKEELRLWKEAGKDKAVMPKVIYVNEMDEYLLKTQSLGCAKPVDETISVRGLLELDGNIDYEGSTLRHEIQHIHELDKKVGKNSFDEWGEAISWKYNKLRYRKKWDKELENAGIELKSHRDYAFDVDKSELRSVTAESNMKKLSQDFKTQMTKKFKMQPWIFDIGDNQVAVDSKFTQSTGIKY